MSEQYVKMTIALLKISLLLEEAILSVILSSIKVVIYG